VSFQIPFSSPVIMAHHSTLYLQRLRNCKTKRKHKGSLIVEVVVVVVMIVMIIIGRGAVRGTISFTINRGCKEFTALKNPLVLLVKVGCY